MKLYDKNSKMHIKIGDTVKVITGNQKGFIGVVNSIMKKNLLFLLMESYHALNILKIHKVENKRKPNCKFQFIFQM